MKSINMTYREKTSSVSLISESGDKEVILIINTYPVSYTQYITAEDAMRMGNALIEAAVEAETLAQRKAA